MYKGFNSPLKLKSDLKRFSKEQLIDMYWDKCEEDKKFMDSLENMTYEQFEELKYTIKCFKAFAKIMTEDKKPSTVNQ